MSNRRDSSKLAGEANLRPRTVSTMPAFAKGNASPTGRLVSLPPSSRLSPPSCAIDASTRQDQSAARLEGRLMKVSLIQMNSISDKAANIAAAEALIERAAREERPDWVLLPEFFDWAGGFKGDKQANAETLPDGPAYEMARHQAIKHRIFVHAGSIMERIEGEDRIHNTSVVFNREGEEIARYRKIHLFDVKTPDGAEYQESKTVKAGDQVVTYDCEGVTVGCSICYDLRFPDLFQALAEKGAQLIALPAAFTMQTGKDHWEVLLRARAIETQTYVCASAQTGSFMIGAEHRYTYGHSLVADPWGHVIAKASDGVGIVSARLDMNQVERVRGLIPVAQQRARIARA
jgi:predicted amidohydrolase